MGTQTWRGQVASATARNKDGTPRLYTVTLADDGTGTCSCTDYIIRSVNAGRPERPCKHIRQAWGKRAGATATERGAAPVTRVPAPAPADSGPGLSAADITRTARRNRR